MNERNESDVAARGHVAEEGGGEWVVLSDLFGGHELLDPRAEGLGAGQMHGGRDGLVDARFSRTYAEGAHQVQRHRVRSDGVDQCRFGLVRRQQSADHRVGDSVTLGEVPQDLQEGQERSRIRGMAIPRTTSLAACHVNLPRSAGPTLARRLYSGGPFVAFRTGKRPIGHSRAIASPIGSVEHPEAGKHMESANRGGGGTASGRRLVSGGI